MNTTYIVKLEPLVSLSELDEEDIELFNDYKVCLNKEFSKNVNAASVVLDVFHSHVAINVLDDFNLSVYKQDSAIPCNLSSDENYQSYSNSDCGYVDTLSCITFSSLR